MSSSKPVKTNKIKNITAMVPVKWNAIMISLDSVDALISTPPKINVEFPKSVLKVDAKFLSPTKILENGSKKISEVSVELELDVLIMT